MELPFYLYTYFSHIQQHYQSSETLLEALEQAAKRYGTIYFKECSDKLCELIIRYEKEVTHSFNYYYFCGKMRQLSRYEVLEWIAEMYQHDQWSQDWWHEDDWDDDDDLDQPSWYFGSRY